MLRITAVSARQWFNVAIIAGALLASSSLAQAQDRKIVFGAGQHGSQNYAINAAIVELLSNHKVPAALQSLGGAGMATALLNKGQLRFSAVTSNTIYQAYHGAGPFKGINSKDLRISAVLIPTTYGLLVADKSPLKNVADIKGKRIPYGFAAQPSIRESIDGLLANAGLSEDDIKPVLVPSVGAGADAFITGKTDAAYFATRGGKLIELDAAVEGVRFLEMSTDDAAIKRMQEIIPTAYVRVVEPKKGLPGISKPTPALAYDYLLVTSKNVSDEEVKQVLTVLDTQAAELKKRGIFSEWQTDRMAEKVADLPYHPAALAYYKSKKAD